MYKVERLGKLATIGSSKRIHLSDYVSSGVPFYRSKEIIELANGQNISEKLFISEAQYEKIKKYYPVPKKGDILITSVGTIGVSYLVQNEHFYFKDGNLTWLRNIDKDLIDVRYLYQWLKSKLFLTQVLNNNIGAVQKAITIDYLKKVNISLPNISTQQKIAAALSALDDKIELNNKINAELEAMAKTLYDYWFVQFDFPDQAGRPYKSSGGAMVWNEQLKREIPEGWEAKRLDAIANIVGGSTPSKEVEDNFTIDGGTSWITPKDLSMNGSNKFISRGEWSVTEKGLRRASLKKLPKGTILMSSRAPVGYLAITSNETTTNQGFKSFVPNGKMPTEFLFFTIQHLLPVIINNASGSTFKEISSSTLKTINSIVPTKLVMENFIRKVSPVFKQQENLENQNQTLSTLRDWLLPMLMNGQVSVGEAYEKVEDVLSVAAEGEEKYLTSKSQS